MTRLTITLAAPDVAPRTAAAGEVADEDRSGVRPVVLLSGESTEVDVDPGGYFVSAQLPSGDRGDAFVLVEGDTPATVELRAGPLPVSGRWALLDRARAAITALVEAPRRGVHAVVWTSREDGVWSREAEVRLSESETTSVSVPRRAQAALAYERGPRGEVVVLPPTSEGRVRIAPLGVDPPAVTLPSPVAETLAAYLDAGRLASAGSLVDYLLERPDRRLVGDPLLEMLVGYQLLRTGDDERLARWRTLDRSGAATADQLVIEGRIALRADSGDEAVPLLVRAASAGPPAYREGLRLLVDGLRRAGREDPEALAALARMGPYAISVDADARLTTFPGRHPQEPEPPRADPTPWVRRHPSAPSLSERRLRTLLFAHAVWSVVAGFAYLAGGATLTAAYIPNSVALWALFAVLSALGAGDVRRYGWLSLVIAFGYVSLVFGLVATLVWGVPTDTEVFRTTVSGEAVIVGLIAVALALALGLAILGNAAIRAANGLRALSPIAFAGIAAFAEVLVDVDEGASAEDVAHNVDGYAAELKGPVRQQIQVALAYLTLMPFLYMRPPLPALAPDRRRRFLERTLMGARIGPFGGPVARLHRSVARVGAQLAYLGYYGDRRVWPSLGYVPAEPVAVESSAAPLRSLPVAPRGGRGEYDAVVIGSGAAGAVIAYRLAEAGRRVLVLERGPHADPRSLPGDEATQYLRFYAQGGLSTDYRLRVLQAACVGGGTTVGDGICLAPPASVLSAWSERGLDQPAIEAAVSETERWLRVSASGPVLSALSVGAARAALPGHVDLLGTGATSMLETVLPEGQQRFPGRLEVLAGCEVEKLVCDGDRVTTVAARRGDSRLSIPVEEVVIAAGAITSSALLRKSGLGGDAVGSGVHFNLRAAVTAEFPDVGDEFRGGHGHVYVAPGDPPAYLVEIWPVRPVAQALALPGWFEEHQDAMRGYRRLLTASVLVGSTTPGRVKPGRAGPFLEYEISDRDRVVLAAGLRDAARLFLAAGAARVFPSTFGWREIRSVGALEYLDLSAEDLLLTSAHPQGGNAIGTVVDDDFRVRGMRNLRICDASVFPTSVHVDPQITVMAVAQYAAGRMLVS